jgi:NAD(P)-dependent dehydrogenase (short-subunit alcohol dehydrogenase family)
VNAVRGGRGFRAGCPALIDLTGKVALVTGASTGMGRAIASTFAAQGATVLVTARDATAAKTVADQIDAAGGLTQSCALDVRDLDDWASAVSLLTDCYGRVDVLVNNAGVTGSHSVDLFDSDIWHELFTTNATGVFYGIKTVAAVMQAAGSGSIVNISSVGAMVGQAGVHPGYSASKGAVRLLTKAAAVNLAADGIRVNSILPGVMPPMKGSGAPPDSPLRLRLLELVPMGHGGSVADVAHAAAFLASDAAAYITGVDLPVDGGYLAM